MLGKSQKKKKSLRVYVRKGRPVSATRSDGVRYSVRHVKHSKHINGKHK